MITQAAQDAKVRARIARVPGIRAEELARDLECDVVSVSASLRRLRGKGRITSRGNTRATTYTVVW